MLAILRYVVTAHGKVWGKIQTGLWTNHDGWVGSGDDEQVIIFPTRSDARKVAEKLIKNGLCPCAIVQSTITITETEYMRLKEIERTIANENST